VVLKRLSLGFTAMLILLLMCGMNFPAFGSAATADISNYSYAKDHTIKGSPDGDLDDYQVLLVVHRGKGSDAGRDVYLGGRSKSWPNDFRFSDAAGRELNYWIESSDAEKAMVWVKMGHISRSPATTTIWLYYGRAGDSGASNGRQTFLYFDDFDSGDQLKWYIGGSPKFEDGAVHLGAGDYVQSTSGFTPGTTALRARISTGIPSDYFTCFGYGGYNPGGGWDYLDQNGAYVWFEYGSVHNIRWFIGYNTVNTGLPLSSAGTWHTYDVYTDPDRYKVTIGMDDIPVLSGKGGIGSPRCIFFGRHYLANGTADVKADWIFARKYTTNEPEHGSWSSEIAVRRATETGAIRALPFQTMFQELGSMLSLVGTSTLCCFSALALVSCVLLVLIATLALGVLKDLLR
jgi:hypothetical protein